MVLMAVVVLLPPSEPLGAGDRVCEGVPHVDGS